MSGTDERLAQVQHELDVLKTKGIDGPIEGAKGAGDKAMELFGNLGAKLQSTVEQAKGAVGDAAKTAEGTTKQLGADAGTAVESAKDKITSGGGRKSRRRRGRGRCKTRRKRGKSRTKKKRGKSRGKKRRGKSARRTACRRRKMRTRKFHEFSPSVDHPGDLDFTTKYGNKDFHRGHHDQRYLFRKPYSQRVGP